ncbi:MAG: thiolase family protein [Bacillota bacterium]
MPEAVIAGVGMHKCGRHPGKSFSVMAAEAAVRALDDAGMNFGDIQAVYASHVMQGASAGQAVCRHLGMTGIPITNVENACASGSTAVRQAFLDIVNGVYESVLVVGFEKMRQGVIGGIGEENTVSEELGLNVMPALYALKANEHMQRYGTTREQMAMVAVKNHLNGCYNPYAHFQKELTVEEVLASRLICDPLRLLECCPTSDGAAAAVICSERRARRHNPGPFVYVAGAALVSEIYGDDPDVTSRAAKIAYEMAGLGPAEIDLAEVHDAFSIGEILHYESLGFCTPGEGGRLVETGRTAINGDIPVNPSGGLQSRGHPLGMTGVAQVCEVVWQLRGQAGRRQVKGPQTGLTHTQGFGGVCAVTILKR